MLSSSQLLELFAVLCVAYGQFSGLVRIRHDLIRAEAKSGPVRPDTVPTGLLGAPFSVLLAIACLLTPTIYNFAIVAAGFQQPPSMAAYALPEVAFGIDLEELKITTRVLACLANVSVRRSAANVHDHLGDQYHPIGRREKQRVVQTGPYAWVRHPLYSIAILQTMLYSLIYWSYGPLFASVIIAAMFAVKIPVEEAVIQRDDGIREEYRAYMNKVPARLIPYVW